VSDSGRSLALQAQFEAARAAWPGIDVTFERFAARAGESHAAFAHDLYLACACRDGDLRALGEFDRRYLPAIHGAVARIDATPDFIAEVQQVLRERLFVGPDPKIDDYRGQGALVGWVRMAAIRTALNLRRASRREVEREQSDEALDPLLGPELAAIKTRCQAELNEALQRAVAALTGEDRLLLRFHYVDRLTLAKIAAQQHVSITTIFRRLAFATETVLATVRTELAARLQLSPESLDSIIREGQDDLDFSLGRLLD
jgi:RNA polymerase sigma-70 factor (ECF subfamily)